MKNKKGAMEMIVGTIITIVLIMAVLVLGIFLVQKIFLEPQFTIYEEVCENETGTLCQMSQEVYENTFCKSCNESFKSEKNLLLCVGERQSCQQLFYDLYCTEVILNIQNCEQVEVEEIGEFSIQVEDCYINKTDLDRKWDECNYDIECLKRLTNTDYGCSRYGNESYKNFRGISKSDLTIEWLEENCDCVGCIGDGHIYEKYNVCAYDTGDWDGKRNVKMGKEKTIPCQKYSCGDKYIVEVIK